MNGGVFPNGGVENLVRGSGRDSGWCPCGSAGSKWARHKATVGFAARSQEWPTGTDRGL